MRTTRRSPRALWSVGPVYVSGAFDVDDDLGVDLAPALAVPLYRESEETRASVRELALRPCGELARRHGRR